MDRLTTDRLTLLPSVPADQDTLYDLFGHPEVMKMFDVGFASPRAFTYQETGQWIKNHIGIDIAPWTIFLKESDEAIGWGGIAYCASDTQP
ncbi:hypothetical protein CCAX7_40320 [Capsulimonas corticalis]|uniref:N-acetyltransferase domain-containing protein n=1 Tax=Capsulimonas corticalis TaxID=2219043 RepID=A0A9N7L5C7_9BACT|nr:GNAT family N-acetyltransferase [Capsulimonas corticalis]BDI31981.1 hypothetical protein CCAX7_40320 [Capsulimonas corticalis]